MPRGPLPSLQIAAGVWTGKELLIYGIHFTGSAGVGVAAAYRPSTRTWRMLATPPQRPNTEGTEKAVWTGKLMMLFVGGTRASYDPQLDRWQTLPDPPRDLGAGPGGHVLAWTGQYMLVWGGGCCGDSGKGGAAYSPATRTWNRMAAAPLAGRYTKGAWTGRELVVAGGSDADGRVFSDAAAYNPVTDHWRQLPPMPSLRMADNATWDGSEVLFTGGGSSISDRGLAAPGVAYDPATNEWRTMPAAAFGRSNSVAVWATTRLLVWDGTTTRGSAMMHTPYGESYSPATNRWTRLPVSPMRGGRYGEVAVWTGSSMLIWGLSSSDPISTKSFTDGAQYTP